MASKEPIELILLKGKKHLGKEEIERRKAEEIKAPADNIEAPSYLSAALKTQFDKIAKELINIGIMSNLDCDALARFVQVQKLYQDTTKELLKRKPVKKIKEIDKDTGEEIEIELIDNIFKELVKTQDKFFTQARAAAGDLGLSISSRCKLVMPQGKKEEETPKSEAEKRFGNRL